MGWKAWRRNISWPWLVTGVGTAAAGCPGKMPSIFSETQWRLTSRGPGSYLECPSRHSGIGARIRYGAAGWASRPRNASFLGVSGSWVFVLPHLFSYFSTTLHLIFLLLLIWQIWSCCFLQRENLIHPAECLERSSKQKRWYILNGGFNWHWYYLLHKSWVSSLYQLLRNHK